MQGKGGDKEENVYMMIPPEPFRREPPLNSTAFLRLKSTKKKRRKDVVFISLRGAPNRLVPSKEVSVILMAHDLSANALSSITKTLRDKYVLTISPFLVD